MSIELPRTLFLEFYFLSEGVQNQGLPENLNMCVAAGRQQRSLLLTVFLD